MRPDFRMERAAMREGVWPVCGTDEAGRGPLAGPVVAAAIILDPKRIPKGLDDSKRMSHAEREAVFEDILDKALAVSIASVSAHSIDRSDIRKASLEAMCRSVKLLCIEPKLVLADGRDIPPGLTCEGKAVVKGDQRSQSIAAASIIAKVTRDRMMTRTASIHVSYGFELHMGYATARHRTAIEAHGPLTRLHRLSFAPFRLDAAE
ncbi:MAG: ribonuclease HII [Aliihoeflea sp.]